MVLRLALDSSRIGDWALYSNYTLSTGNQLREARVALGTLRNVLGSLVNSAALCRHNPELQSYRCPLLMVRSACVSFLTPESPTGYALMRIRL